MLILTGNKTVNFEQAFYFAVETSMPYMNMGGAKAYNLMAYHGNNGDDPDSVVMKSYHTKEEAYADLRKIITGCHSGAVCVNLDTD